MSGQLPYKRVGGSYQRIHKESMPDEAVGYCNTWPLNFRLAFMEGTEKNPQDALILSVSKGNSVPSASRSMHLNLTDLTEAELKAVRSFFILAIDAAEPIVKARDRAAEDAWRIDRDDTYFRQTRSLPNVVVRNGPLFQYTERFIDRSTYIPRVDRQPIVESKSDRTNDDAVAQPNENGGEVASDSQSVCE